MATATGKSAIIFGATGLVGSFVLQQLLRDDRYREVNIFQRRTSGSSHPKLREHIVDFNHPGNSAELITGDELYCCLGTTIRTAGSQEAFRAVDYGLVKWCAEAAQKNGVKMFLVVSSLGADARSGNFYLRTKGEMETAVAALPFEKYIAFRPSMLLGPRKEFRFGERIGKFFMQLFAVVIPKRYKAVEAETVARAMIKAANDGTVKTGVMESDRIRSYGKPVN